MILHYPCPICKKQVKTIQSEFPVGNKIVYVYNCGHTEIRDKIPSFEPTKDDIAIINAVEPDKLPDIDRDEYKKGLSHWLINGAAINFYEDDSIYSLDKSKKAYPFQVEGIKFAERTQDNCLIADAMGLGKTIQSLLVHRRAYQSYVKAFPKEKFVTLAIVKGATIFQWTREFKEWVSDDFSAIIPVTHRSHIVPGFQFYVISMDLLARKGVLELLGNLNIKCVIIDECQSFKDSEAKRSKALVKLIQLNEIKHKIALSGTPIKNRADEYFTILNLLAPAWFTSPINFKCQWLIQNDKGAYTRINPLMLDKFKELTSRWIIRREKHDVLKNLPDLRRDYQIIEIEDENIRKSYNHQLDLFGNFLRNTAQINSQDLLGWLARLRAITGQAKCKNAIEFVQDFLDSTEEKIAIGVHHHSVSDTLSYIFNEGGYSPLKIDGHSDAIQKDRTVDAFNKEKSRILILSSLAGGVGLNLQTCANALVLERQWNSADEEQFESRFHRDGQKKAVIITYLIAKGTIDEFFHEMVVKKRQILVETGIGNENDVMNDIDFLKDFAEYVSTHKI